MVRLVEPNEAYLQSYMDAFMEYEDHQIASYGLSDAKAIDIFEKYDNLNFAPQLFQNST